MSTLKRFDDLQQLGSSQIARQTHIAQGNIDVLFKREFDKIGKVQLKGFISILEREYTLDLSDLLREYDEYHLQKSPPDMPVSDVFIDTVKESRRIRLVYLGYVGLFIAVLIGVILVALRSDAPAQIEVNNTAIDKAKETMKYVALSSKPGSEAYEVNVVQEKKLLEQQTSQRVEIEEPKLAYDLKENALDITITIHEGPILVVQFLPIP